MIVSTIDMLRVAEAGVFAIGGFNVYNLEGAKAVVSAAESLNSCALIQIRPAALRVTGLALIDACLACARAASVPIAVHLDHTTTLDDIQAAIDAGVTSVMGDGSHLDYDNNVTFVRQVVAIARAAQLTVESVLGQISGEEDDLPVAEYEAQLTCPEQAALFVKRTGTDILAVCIGNAHGVYHHPRRLDFDRLARIREVVDVPLVLHGASGLEDALIQQAIELGVRKFNVNTEARQAYLRTIKTRVTEPNTELIRLLQESIHAMRKVIEAKLRLFGSVDSKFLFENGIAGKA